jgi:hypothetical protein
VDPEINPHSYSHLIAAEAYKIYNWAKDYLFLKLCWENWIFTHVRLILEPYLFLCTKINSKWIIDPHVRPEILKPVQKDTEKTPQDIGISQDFLYETIVAQEIRARINKWD